MLVKVEAAAPAAMDQLDLEAAEQLIQLSGGDSDDAVSESKSADSVKCRREAAGGAEKKDKEAAVESRRRTAAEGSPAGKDGDGGEAAGESGRKSADSFTCSRAAGMERKDEDVAVGSRRRSAERLPTGKDGANGGVDKGEPRRRPRFRLLADMYRETKTTTTTTTTKRAVDEESESPRKKKRLAAEEVIPVEASKEIRRDLK